MKNNKFLEGYYDHLSYYIENKISPVHQNISNLNDHYDRRNYLYDNLGINKLLIKKSIIFEFGPGSGHNSLYLSKVNPKKYCLFEPNPTGYIDIKNLYAKYPLIKKPIIYRRKLEDYKKIIYGKADIVIAEAWIGSLKTELNLIKKLSNMINKNGFLIMTFQPSIGMLPNMLRRILSYKIINYNDNFKLKSDKLSNFFSKELSDISKMSRPIEDWTQDTLLNPAAMTSVLSIEQILNQLGHNFQIYNTYPKYFKSFDWYKNFIGKKRNMNKVFTDQIYKNYYSFLDMKKVYEKDSSIQNSKKLNSLINQLYFLLFNLEKNNLKIERFKNIEIILTKIIKASENQDLKNIVKSTLSLIKSKDLFNNYYTSKNKLLGIFGKELCYISLQKIK